MNRHVNAIAGRLSLRPPQRESLEALDRILTLVPPSKTPDIDAALAVIGSEYHGVTDFEREFPSLCFALATGVGKTRLMGAFITYLHLAHGIDNFFVLAPNLTIYNKLIADFTPNTPKYVFKGIAEFASTPPVIITGDTYESQAGSLFDIHVECRINIFNVSKINTEVRGGRSPRIKRLSEYIGESYFDYLAGLPDLVLLMDESHRYRASAGVRAINELKPILGLELTATPYVETARGATPFRNVVVDYPLSRAMADGFVKEPAVVTRRNFDASAMSKEEIERIKLEDGIRLHESVKVELETYARETGLPVVKPFVLVIARDTDHAKQLSELVASESFFDGRYAGRVLQVDSSKGGADEEEMIARLLTVESTDEPTEIVIHVNMLKEGWDVTNLYTIVPLRAANARVLIEQSIGRGLRLPYGRRTGVAAVDRLNIVAHDRFKEIVDEASSPGSIIQMKQIVLEPDDLDARTVTVVAAPQSHVILGFAATTGGSMNGASANAESGEHLTDSGPVFASPAERSVARIVYDEIRRLENDPVAVPTLSHLQRPEVQEAIVAAVAARRADEPLEIEGLAPTIDIASIVAKTVEVVTRETIDIPRIVVVPKTEVRSGFRPFQLDLSGVRYQPVDEALWSHYLRTGQSEVLALGHANIREARLADYVVAGLVDFDDVSYDDHADLLYELAEQVVTHLLAYLSEEEAARVLRTYQREIARLVHAQMQEHFWEETVEYEVRISRGYTELKTCAFTAISDGGTLTYRTAPKDKSNMARYLFTGFSRCLYPYQKFQSDPERRLAIILERDAMRWFRPAKGQFQIYYRFGVDHHEYQPDFVAETPDVIYMLEPKAANEVDDEEVKAKAAAADQWCRRASDHATANGGKPWRYAIIPHDRIIENATLEWIAGD